MQNENLLTENHEWAALTYEEKNSQLFQRQKQTLDLFLERGAISKAQYDKSLHDLKEKMKVGSSKENINSGSMCESVQADSQ